MNIDSEYSLQPVFNAPEVPPLYSITLPSVCRQHLGSIPYQLCVLQGTLAERRDYNSSNCFQISSIPSLFRY